MQRDPLIRVVPVAETVMSARLPMWLGIHWSGKNTPTTHATLTAPADSSLVLSPGP